jgi:hypothetical protein
MSVIFKILAVMGGLGFLLIAWGVYSEAKLNKKWDEAYETESFKEDWIRTHNSFSSEGETSSEAPKKRGRPAGSKNQPKQITDKDIKEAIAKVRKANKKA